MRSSYASPFLPNVNSNQVQRIAYVMRTSPAMLYKNYLKKSNESEEEVQEEKTKATQQTTPKTIIRWTPEEITKYKQNRTDYFSVPKKEGGIIRTG